MTDFAAIISPGLIDFIIYIVIILLKIAVVIGIGLLHVAYATYFERKVIAHMQVRLGPREVGPLGLFQPFADGIKLFFKEDIIPAQSDKPIFYLAPVIFFISALTSLSVIPFFDGFAIADINIGLLFLFRDVVACSIRHSNVGMVFWFEVFISRRPQVSVTGHQL
jgi:NADH-quinone oxidoreductase subunit H